ncbi:hypothetical protein HAX54_039710, partial [Datura stramonium]|nr:hypothetical protein [Datura stramonium]
PRVKYCSKRCISGAGVTGGVTFRHIFNSRVDGNQLGDGSSFVPSSVMVEAMVRQSSDKPSLGVIFWAILFKPDGGDDEPSGL